MQTKLFSKILDNLRRYQSSNFSNFLIKKKNIFDERLQNVRNCSAVISRDTLAVYRHLLLHAS